MVTGANSGLGLHTSLELARHGARVVLGVRDGARGAAAAEQIGGEVPGAALEVRALDLADLASVRAFAALLAAERLDLLVNNAGVMAIPRRTTADGFEMQFGTNHLGHFALTGLLLPRCWSSCSAARRVVTVSSTLHRRGRLDRDDLMGERSYSPWRAYGQSKLANLLFMRELQRRVDAAGVRLMSWRRTLAMPRPTCSGRPADDAQSGQGGGLTVRNLVLAQPASRGAWPTLRAATDPGARGGDYYGPGGLAEQRGHPVLVGMSAAGGSDAGDAWRLGTAPIELTVHQLLRPGYPGGSPRGESAAVAHCWRRRQRATPREATHGEENP